MPTGASSSARASRRRLGAEPEYTDIEMPRNSPTGFICAFFATFMGFALIWHIWWLVAVGIVGAYATFVVFAWRDRVEYVIPAEEVARIDRANRSARSEALARPQAAHMSAFEGTADGDPDRIGAAARTSASPDASTPPATGLQADHRRLRLLDLPAQRHRHVLGLLRDLRGAGRCDRRRPERAGAVRAAQRRDRDRLPAALELHLRPGAASAPSGASDRCSMAPWR